MATIIRKEERDYQPNQNKIDGFRLFTDISREKKEVNPQSLNFDLRQLTPRQYSAPYHLHRYTEEMFLILSGSVREKPQYTHRIIWNGIYQPPL